MSEVKHTPKCGEARKALNNKHLLDPQPGDYWHECFTPILLVVSVNGALIEYVDTDHLTSDLDGRYFGTEKPMHRGTWMSLVKKLSYENSDGTWADVLPGKLELVEDLLARHAEESK